MKRNKLRWYIDNEILTGSFYHNWQNFFKAQIIKVDDRFVVIEFHDDVSLHYWRDSLKEAKAEAISSFKEYVNRKQKAFNKFLYDI